jgi:hypothetical protein
VLEPPEVRERMAATATAMHRTYDRSGSVSG